MSIFLDEFSQITEKFSEKQIEEYKIQLEDFFDHMEDASGINKYSGLVSFFVMWSILKNKCNISSDNFRNITDNEEYKSTIQSHASGKTNIEKRFKYVYEQLSKSN